MSDGEIKLIDALLLCDPGNELDAGIEQLAFNCGRRREPDGTWSVSNPRSTDWHKPRQFSTDLLESLELARLKRISVGPLAAAMPGGKFNATVDGPGGKPITKEGETDAHAVALAVLQFIRDASPHRPPRP